MKSNCWCRVVGPLLVCWALSVWGDDLSAQVQPRRAGGLYGSIGIGFMNLEKGPGLSIPVGMAMVLTRYRLVGSVSALDIGLLQGSDRNSRYVRTYYGAGRTPGCWDNETGYPVSSFRCSGGTDALSSSSVDLSYVVVENLWVAGKSGMLYTGLGHRFLNPRTFYWTLGMYFDGRSNIASGFKGAFGKNYVYFGLVWGYDLRQLVKKF